MGSNARGCRSIRTRGRSRRPPPPAAAPITSLAPSSSSSNPVPVPNHTTPNPSPSPSLDLNLSSNPNPNPNPDDSAGWGYCTEEQLEDLLLNNLDLVYKEALSRLVSLGYDHSLALRSLLCNGHCYGSMDVLSNVLHNAVAFLNAPPSPDGTSPVPPTFAFSDLRHLQEYSLASMVCLLQQVRPTLTRGDAMWCLLMSELHIGRASALEIPSLHPSSPALPTIAEFDHVSTADSWDPSLGCPRQFLLPPSVKPPPPLPALPPYHPSEEEASANADIVASVMKSLESMSIAEENAAPDAAAAAAESQKKEAILGLVCQIRELEVQVKERREWAQQKALQAARKLSNDLAELNALRAECEENQRAKKGKQTLDDSTMKRLSEMEAALKKASAQVDRANAVVRRLETENAEIRAEMEASKLSASESTRTIVEVAKRERKRLKRLMAWEKQREKLQAEIAEERRGVIQLQQQLNEVQEAQKETEKKWRQEIKAKERAISLVDEERRAKEAAEVRIKRNHEALRQKIEIDFQRHKDDIQRLEEELSRLKVSGESTQLSNPTSNALGSGHIDVSKPREEANLRMLRGINKPQLSTPKKNHGRECVICMQDEVSVVFLPCAHQVICARCNEQHEKRAKSACPCCNSQIEERIRVYGASS